MRPMTGPFAGATRQDTRAFGYLEDNRCGRPVERVNDMCPGPARRHRRGNGVDEIEPIQRTVPGYGDSRPDRFRSSERPITCSVWRAFSPCRRVGPRRAPLPSEAAGALAAVEDQLASVVASTRGTVIHLSWRSVRRTPYSSSGSGPMKSNITTGDETPAP
jgi:hypothetical protein